MPGHVANRLQLALYREVLYLIEQDVLSVADADDAVSWGPGLRWGVMGPSLQWHVGGGAGGIKHFLEGVFEGLHAGVQDARRSEDHAGAQGDDRSRRVAGGRPAFGRAARRARRTSCSSGFSRLRAQHA